MAASYTSTAADTLYVDASSARFAYRRLGPRGGVPLVLLHRFRGALDWWDPELLDLFAADHDVILFDNIGIGYTEGTPMTTVKGFAAGAIEFVEALGLANTSSDGPSAVSSSRAPSATPAPHPTRRSTKTVTNPGRGQNAKEFHED